MPLSSRLSKLRQRLTAALPTPALPLVVLAATASPDHPPGRWVRADGATVGVRLADGQPFPKLPGDPLVISGENDSPTPPCSFRTRPRGGARAGDEFEDARRNSSRTTHPPSADWAANSKMRSSGTCSVGIRFRRTRIGVMSDSRTR